jgi:hypothetical protein
MASVGSAPGSAKSLLSWTRAIGFRWATFVSTPEAQAFVNIKVSKPQITETFIDIILSSARRMP